MYFLHRASHVLQRCVSLCASARWILQSFIWENLFIQKKTHHLFRKKCLFVTCVFSSSRESRAAALCVFVCIRAMNSGTNHLCKKKNLFITCIFFANSFFLYYFYTHRDTQCCSTRLARWIFRKNVQFASFVGRSPHSCWCLIFDFHFSCWFWHF